MKGTIKKALSYVFAVVLALSCISQSFITAKATSGGVTLGTGSPTLVDMAAITGELIEIKTGGLYIDGVSEGETAVNPDGYEFTGTYENKTISALVDAKIILNNFNATLTGKTFANTAAISVSNINSEIILKSGTANSITVTTASGGTQHGLPSGTNCYAIEKDGETGTMTMGTSSGNNDASLSVIADNHHNGAICSRVTRSFANFTFTSGILTVTAGSTHNPAIGAGCNNGTVSNTRASNIRITGGIVNATGGNSCAAIGGGGGVPVDGIYISGGASVVARGGACSPGIGSGGTNVSPWTVSNFAVSNVEITGGDTIVTAYGDEATNMPGIGCGKAIDGFHENTRTLTNVTAIPQTDFQGYVKYGTSDTDYSFSTANPTTPFPTTEEIGAYLQAQAAAGNPVYYTQVYFGPYADHTDTTDNAEINSNDTSTKTGGTALTPEQLRSLTYPRGHDEDGNNLSEEETAKIVYNQEQADYINEMKVAGKLGDFPLTYTYTYTDTTGNDVTLTTTSIVSLRGTGTDSAEDDAPPTLNANNAIHKTGGEAFSKSDVLLLTDALANNGNGQNVLLYSETTHSYPNIPTEFVVDQTKFDALNAAKTAGEVGTYPMTYTYTDPKTGNVLTVDVNVKLFGNGNETVQGPEIGAEDVYQKADGNTFTEDDIRTASGVAANDSNGNPVPSTNLIPDPDQFAAINEARESGVGGTFDLDYTFEDINGETVTVSTKVYLWLGQPPVVFAEDKTISSTTAHTEVTTVDDLDQFTNPHVLVNTDGTMTTVTNKTIDPADLAKIAAGTPGKYKVTYTYNYTDDEAQPATKTKDAYITVVDNLKSEATDATVKASDAKEYTAKTDLIEVLKNEVTLDDGTKVTPTDISNVVVSDADWQDITNGVVKDGGYEISFTYTDDFGVTKTSSAILTITDSTTITAEDKTIHSTEAKDITDPEGLTEIMGGKVTLDDGTEADPDTVTVDPDDFADIQNGVVGDYEVTFTYTDPDSGKVSTITKKLTVVDSTTITAEDKTIHSTEAKDITDPEGLTEIMGGKVTLDDGTEADPDTVTVDPDDFADIQNGVEGDYKVTFTYTDPDSGKVSTITKTLKVVDGTKVTAENTTIKSGDAKKVTGTTDLIKIMGGKVTLDDGTEIDPKTVTVDPDDLTNIKNGVEGNYDVTFSYTDPDSGKKVEVTKILTVSDKTTIIATDTTMSITDAKKTIKEEKDLITVMEGKVTLDDGTVVVPDTVTCDKFSSIKHGIPGVYDVTFSYTDPKSGKKVEVTKKLTLTNAATIVAEDATITPDEGKKLEHQWFIKDFMNSVVTLDDGTKLTATGSSVSDSDWEKIQAGTPGKYEVTLWYDDGFWVISTKNILTIAENPNSVDTSDHSNIIANIVLFQFAILGLAAAFVFRKKHVEE